MAILYNLVLHLMLIPAFPILLIWVACSRKRRRSLISRLGLSRWKIAECKPGTRPIWIHALSLGEVLSALPLIDELKQQMPDVPIVFSASTLTGLTTAEQKLKHRVDLIFPFPLDYPAAILRPLNHLNPRAIILTETDIWPNFIRIVHKRHIPLFLVNGRLSDRTYAGYRRLSWLTRNIFRSFDGVCAQSKTDARRYANLGVPDNRIHTIGNLKLDQTRLHDSDAVIQGLRKKLGISANAPILVGGSTHEGEEEQLLLCHAALNSILPKRRLIIVPRDPDRARNVFREACKRGLSVQLYSRLSQKGLPPGEVLVIDGIGLLRSLYSLARVAFIGGSLVPTGGHNPVEASIAGCPVLFGPHTDNFRQMTQNLLTAGGAFRVKTPEALFKKSVYLMSNPDEAIRMGAKGRELVLASRGASNQTARMIKNVIDQRPVTNISGTIPVPAVPFHPPVVKA